MYIDLIDHLRCTANHDESWLVAAVDGMEGRYVARGSLGCPLCQTTYPVRDFVAYFEPSVSKTPDPNRQLQAPTDEVVTRLAALLDLRTPGGFVGLASGWSSCAAPLALAFDVQCVVLDSAGLGVPGDGVSVLSVNERIPLAPKSLRAFALDAGSIAPASVVRAVKPGGRVTGPALLAVPDGVNEIARDARDWVGERGPDELLFIELARIR